MKKLFIPVKYKIKQKNLELKKLLNKLPNKIAIAYSIQYKELAFYIKKILGSRVTSIVQVLGCSRPKFPNSTQAVLLIGSGRFHAIPLSKAAGLPIYILESNKLHLISKKEIEEYDNLKKIAKLKFLKENKVGILVSTKPGQQRLSNALNVRKTLNKKSYIFISNNINIPEFQNFNLNSWINTACPRLDMDYPLLNSYELKELSIRNRK